MIMSLMWGGAGYAGGHYAEYIKMYAMDRATHNRGRLCAMK